MKVLTNQEFQFIKWMQDNRTSPTLSFKEFLEEHFFNSKMGNSIIVQPADKFCIYFLTINEYENTTLRNKKVAALTDLVSFLAYLNKQGFITFYTREINESRKLYFLGTIFRNPRVTRDRIILDNNGLNSADPESICDEQGNRLYRGIKLMNANFDLIYKNLLDDFCISKSISQLHNVTPTKKLKKNSSKQAGSILNFILTGLTFLMCVFLIASTKDNFDTLFFRLSSISLAQTKQSNIANAIKEPDIGYGIDISKWSGDLLNEGSLPNDLNFIIVKATQGLSYIDPMFAKNWQKVPELNLTRGAYHFYVAGVDPIKQAKHFWKQISDLKINDIAPIVDIESDSLKPSERLIDSVNIQVELLIFLDQLEKLSQRKPIVYSSLSFANKHITHKSFSNYALWIADYTDRPTPRLPNAWINSDYTIWQKSNSYSIGSKKIDFDVYKNFSQLTDHFYSKPN